MEKLNIENAKKYYLENNDYDQASKLLFSSNNNEVTKLNNENILIKKARLLYNQLDSITNKETIKLYQKIITILLINYVLRINFKLFKIKNYVELTKKLENELLDFNDNSEIENLKNKIVYSKFNNTTMIFYLNQKSFLRLKYNRNNPNIPKAVLINNYPHVMVKNVIDYLNGDEDELDEESLDLYNEIM